MSRRLGLFSAVGLIFAAGQALAAHPAQCDADKYVLLQFLQTSEGFYYYEAKKCPNGPEVTLKCSEEHTVGQGEIEEIEAIDCGCEGQEYPDCEEVARGGR